MEKKMEKEMEQVVEIPLSEYKSLLENYRFLQKLHNAGVDNWEGYEFAFEDDDD